jgi:hypothetical protein
MRSIGGAHLHWQAGAANAAWRTRALQKPSTSSDLNGESHNTGNEEPHPAPQTAPTVLRQSGTEDPVSFRHAAAPRLTAAFTAQLLGQILPDPERRSPARGYCRQTFPLPLGIDKRL